MDELFSATWLGYSPAQAEVFKVVSRSLMERRRLSFTYSSPRQDTTPNHREVEPHHLQHYMGSWVLLARCRLRDDWRKFLLSRMENPTLTDDEFTPHPRDQWLPQLEGAYGIFQGKPPARAVIRFTPARARWIKEQVWHPDQRLDETPDGGLLLTLPVADYREIKLRLLQYGADAEVLEPAALRAEIEQEITRMTKVYAPKPDPGKGGAKK